MKRHICITLLSCLAVTVLAGCASNGGFGKSMHKAMNSAMQGVGLKKAGEAARKQLEHGYELPLDLYAGVNLNAGSGERPLALVVKLYQLRDTARFDQTTFDTFLDEDKQKAALGPDLIASREVLVQPGQHYQVSEKMGKGAAYLGVVALFRGPAKRRWRAVFDGRKSHEDGIKIGLQACALTVTRGDVLTQFGSPADSLSAVHCPETSL